MFKYAKIWKEIKQNASAEIVVHEGIVATVIQGVKRTKSAENVNRSKVSLIPYSKLVIQKEVLSERTKMVKVTFKLDYDTRL